MVHAAKFAARGQPPSTAISASNSLKMGIKGLSALCSPRYDSVYEIDGGSYF
jgi:hypothetical protein